MTPPNVLWICSDQQRFDTLGCYGNGFVRTPNLDRLAAEGVLFEHCYSQSPICTPSRAGFLTGRYPRTTRCCQNGQSIPDDEVLVTRLLAEAGYACGLSGKLHLSACHHSLEQQAERRIDDGYTEFHWSHHPHPDWPANEYIRWLAERGVPYETTPFEEGSRVRTGMPTEHHQTTWCAEKAIDFMEAHAGDGSPWLFSVNMFDPHHPFDPPGELLAPYLERLDEIPLPNYVEGELADKPPHQRIGGYIDDPMSDREHRLVRSAYWAMIDLIDEAVGRMLDALDRTGQRDRTLVIFTSDHGEMLGDHGRYLKGPYFYDPAVRVPLIVSLPDVAGAGRRSAAMVELIDLAPTLVDACGLDRPPGMQARSLWPLLTGAAPLDDHRRDVYCEFLWPDPADADRPAATMVRTRRHKIVVTHNGQTGELYDLAEDPTETHNRWDDPGCASIKASLLKRACDRMAATADPLPPRSAPW